MFKKLFTYSQSIILNNFENSVFMSCVSEVIFPRVTKPHDLAFEEDLALQK